MRHTYAPRVARSCSHVMSCNLLVYVPSLCTHVQAQTYGSVQAPAYCSVTWRSTSDISYARSVTDFRFLSSSASFNASTRCTLSRSINVTSYGALVFPVKGIYTINVAVRAAMYTAWSVGYVGIAPRKTREYGNGQYSSSTAGAIGGIRLASSSLNPHYTTTTTSTTSFTGIFHTADEVDVFYWSTSAGILISAAGDTRVTVNLIRSLK